MCCCSSNTRPSSPWDATPGLRMYWLQRRCSRLAGSRCSSAIAAGSWAFILADRLRPRYVGYVLFSDSILAGLEIRQLAEQISDLKISIRPENIESPCALAYQIERTQGSAP